MLIAQQKKQTNLAEYILYMWQIEDLIRLHQFDISLINDSVISKFDVSTDKKAEIKMWYQQLIDQMIRERKSESGHIREITQQVEELNNLHNSLLTTIQDKSYQKAYIASKDNIKNFMSKSGNQSSSEIEACLVALYGLLVLKLKGSEVGRATSEAIKTFSTLIAILIDRHNKLRKGELLFSAEKSN